MRTRSRRLVVFAALVLASLTPGVTAAPARGSTLGTSFTYQGQLQQSGAPTNGTCDFQFDLFAAPSAGSTLGTQSTSSVGVTSGLFSVELNFGDAAFAGEDRYLEIQVRCPAGSGSFSVLSPRQRLTAAPYALYASSSGSANGLECTGCVSEADLASGAVGTTQLGIGAVTGNKIAAGTVTSDHVGFNYANSNSKGGPATDLACSACVADADLAANAVTPAKISPGAVDQVLTTTGGGVSWQTPAGDITAVNAGTGLSGGGASGAVTLNVTFAGSGAASSAARSDHDHYGAAWSGAAGTGLSVTTANAAGTALYGLHGTTSGAQPGIRGETSSSSPFAAGVIGRVTSTSPGGGSAGVRGINEGTGGSGIGVEGSQNGSGWGVYGTSLSGRGVYGSAGAGGVGVRAEGGGGTSTALEVANGAIKVPPGSNSPVFVHTATATGLGGTVIDHPLTNNDPTAILIVTRRTRSVGGGGWIISPNVAVHYVTSENKWYLFQDPGTTISSGDSWNVLVFKQ